MTVVKITNFRDIPRFTMPASYHVNIPLDYLVQQIDRYVGNGLQLNPDFQRGHVWTEAQQIAYVEYFLRGGTSGREIYLNLPGLNWGEAEFVCVDGLQRITACLRFMENEIPAFGTLYKDYEGRISQQMNLSLWINTLETRQEVLTWYLELNSSGTAHTEAELDKVRGMIAREHRII